MNCALFVSWLGQFQTPATAFNAIEFFPYCVYFQVSEDCWNIVQAQFNLPALYSQMTSSAKSVFKRKILPFNVAKKIVCRVEAPIERVLFMFSWFNEKSATTPSEKRVLETCDDFFLLRDLATQTLSAATSYWSRSKEPQISLSKSFAEFPLALNSLNTLDLLKLLTTTSFLYSA